MEKKLKLGYVKAVDAKKGIVDAYISTFDWDRMDERFIKGAWDLEQFKKNPVVLWSHDMSIPPIGKNVEMIEDDHGLLARTQFDKEGALAQQVLGLYARGFLNAFSVGFIRKNYVIEQMSEEKKGLSITDAELYEYSGVSVPAQPGALVSREVAELAIKTIGKEAIHALTANEGSEQFFLVPTPGKPDDLSLTIKKMIELAKVAKGSNLPQAKRSLILTAVSVFNEVLAESPRELSTEELKALQSGLTDFANVTAIAHPDVAVSIQKLISQVGKAVTGKE